MHRIFMRAMCLELNRDMGNSEIVGDPAADGLEQFACERTILLVDQHMTGQHHQPWFNGPHVQIVNVIHAGNRFNGGRNMRGADARRCRFKQNFQRFAEDRPRAAENGPDQEKAYERVENRPAGQHNPGTAQNHA